MRFTDLHKYNIIPKQKYGFEKKVSAQDAINSPATNIHLGLNNDEKIIAVFIYWTKAFVFASYENWNKRLHINTIS